MAIRDMVRRATGERGVARRQDNPMWALQERMNRMFEELWSGGGTEMSPSWGSELTGAYVPRVDVNETDEAVEVSAELPGLAQKDVELTLTSEGDGLILRGEKREEHQERHNGGYSTERSFGSFRRTIPLPALVDEKKCEATMRDGVLHVKLIKRSDGGGRKRINIKS